MSLTPGFANVYDLFEKLKRDAALLDEEVTADRFFNFVVTGWSMEDWVKNDQSLPAAVCAVQTIRNRDSYEWIQVCGDVANSLKHFQLNKRTPITASATSSSGYGIGRYGKGSFVIGEESIEIVLCDDDGTTFKAAQLVKEVISFWQAFLTDLRLHPKPESD